MIRDINFYYFILSHSMMKCILFLIIVVCVSVVIGQNACDVDGNRVDCGYAGITLSECEDAGCCWYPVYNNPNNEPWCFYKNGNAQQPQPSHCINKHDDYLGNLFLNKELGTYFAVWSPHASQVWINGNFSGNMVIQEMTLCSADSYWAIQIPQAQPGDEYYYTVSYLGVNYTRIDPLCREVISNSNGDYVASKIHNPEFNWGESSNFIPPSHFEQVIYEMQISTFNPTTPGAVATFYDAISKLDYLQYLGINVIEVLPVIEFPGSPRGWGYNPGAPFAIESSFGGYDGLREFIKESALRGIAVYIDIVWNHMNGPPQNGLWQFDGWYEYDNGFPSGYGLPGGIYFYQDENAETSWGPRPNYDDTTVRRYVIHNIEMLMKECHASGFRWDSTICIRKGEQACWDMPNDLVAGYTLLQASTTFIRDLGGFSIAEDLQNNATVTNPTSQGGIGFDAQWSDTTWYNLDDVLGTQDDSKRSISQFVQAVEASYPGGGLGAWRVLYTENHDKSSGQNEGQGRWPMIVDSSNPTSYIAQKLSVLGYTTVLVSPGVPMLFYGQEFLDTENFVFGDVPDFPWSDVGEFRNNTWISIGPNNGIFNLTRTLVRLRLNLDNYSDALTTTSINTFWSSQSDLTVAFTRGNNQDMVILMNLKSQSYEEGYNIGVPYSGIWNIVFNSDLQEYSSIFGNVGASQNSLETINTPLMGMPYQVSVPLGAYSTVILVQLA